MHAIAQRSPEHDALAQGALEIERQLLHAHDESQRLQKLLDDAIGSLVTSFDALDAIAHRKHSPTGAQAPHASAATPLSAVEAAAALAAVIAELRQQLNNAAVALQFHDMASQLGGHARRHIEQARKLSGGLHALAGRIAARVPLPAAQEAAHDATPEPTPGHTLNGLVVAARRTLSSPVPRALVSAGEVEFF